MKRSRPIRGLLVDLDGVLYVGDRPVDGAAEAVARLRTRGLPLRFLTNTSTRPVAEVEAKLMRLGFDPQPGEVVSAVRAAVLTLSRLSAAAPYLVVDERIASEFDRFSPVGLFPEPPTAEPDFVVVGDIGPRWSYALMNDLYRLCLDGARLLALHKGRSWQTAEGLQLDIGAFVAGLEYAAGVEAIVTGKPSAGIFEAAVGDIGLEAREVVMVGDDIDGDIGGAQAAGIRGVLVRTGKYRRAVAEGSKVKPWATVDSIAGLDALITR